MSETLENKCSQDPSTDTPYVWSNSWDKAEQRLTLLNEPLDAGTRHRMLDLGLGPGWRCLDVATGAGSVARWLSERVGPQGHVVATDVDTRLLSGLKADNLEVLQHNILTDPPPGRDFHLIHTRGLLMHLPQREQVLGALIDLLAPGGNALIEEFDLYAIKAIGSPAYAAAWALVSSLLAKAGFHDSWARGLPSLLTRAGLTSVKCVAETIFFPGGSSGAQWVLLTWEQALERFDPSLNHKDEIIQARRELADRERWFVLPTLVCAWGYRPARAS